jgi:galactokinase/mevalonate kinase-like predicted kinase
MRIQNLLTLPPRMAAEYELLEGRRCPEWVASSDPPGRPLGSGGGTANLLADAWRRTGGSVSFEDWLRQSQKLVLHGGGQSRRLPAYAAVGKLLMPMPVFRWSRGQRLDQSLLDLQLPDYQRVLTHAGAGYAAMIASGDVLLRFAPRLEPFPQVDVLGLGMWVPPETAKDFGVLVSPRQRPGELAFFLQKPDPARIRELSAEHLCLVDTGMWLLSERAVQVLMAQCGWNPAEQRFAEEIARPYEFYSQFALALGRTPTVEDPAVRPLSCAVVPLPEAQFYHFGTSAQMIESVASLQNLVLDQIQLGGANARYRSDQVTQNARFEVALRRDENARLWVENSCLSKGWQLASDHVLTGVPENDWTLRLERGVCLDFVPVRDEEFCIRFYGFEDAFRGALTDPATQWLGRSCSDWFKSRGMDFAQAGLDPQSDIQNSPLFPVLARDQIESAFLEWLVAAQPENNSGLADLWRRAPRLSAQQLGEAANLRRLYQQRARFRQECLAPMRRNHRASVFYRLDLEATARLFAPTNETLLQISFTESEPLLEGVHDPMFRSAVQRLRNQPEWKDSEAAAFERLRSILLQEAQLAPAQPVCQVKTDQIVWARSPVRLDLAGGWSDTPPYCLEHGGRVLNLGVDLNGQPPIQVFAKLCDRPELVLRSIDLGVEERVRTYEELAGYARPENPFSLAKAGLALAGFLPQFHSAGRWTSLESQLRDFGGGIELSLLCAVPKGSGLGTSSILAATVLAALSDLCGLNWSLEVLFARTMALEQMLTTGGGWQDQAGALFRGVKVIETTPGLSQKPLVRWLPEHLFDRERANRTIFLYYTGLTRLAKNILSEIVRGIFLNSHTHLQVIAAIHANAEAASAAVQRCDYAGLMASIDRSWQLNQHLDAGTNPPAVQQILNQVQDYLGAAKLLGAGGGGYLLLFAKDEMAGLRLKHLLLSHPPNARARFVDFSLSQTGLQVTRS